MERQRHRWKDKGIDRKTNRMLYLHIIYMPFECKEIILINTLTTYGIIEHLLLDKMR